MPPPVKEPDARVKDRAEKKYPIGREQRMGNTHVSFIGLGRMGGAMAANLFAASVPLFVFDAREEAVEPLVLRGATIVSNPAKLADKVE